MKEQPDPLINRSADCCPQLHSADHETFGTSTRQVAGVGAGTAIPSPRAMVAAWLVCAPTFTSTPATASARLLHPNAAEVSKHWPNHRRHAFCSCCLGSFRASLQAGEAKLASGKQRGDFVGGSGFAGEESLEKRTLQSAQTIELRGAFNANGDNFGA